jgi:hypothetical protein
MYGTNPATFPMHYTFNTPTTALPANQCGRVMFSDFHVNTGATGTGTFPKECNLGTGVKLTAQEKVLEFMLMDLTLLPQGRRSDLRAQEVRGLWLQLRSAR